MIRLLIVLFFSITLSFGTAIKYYVMDYTKKSECVVRHLKVYKNPKWAAKIELVNGKKIFFSSPKSMFEFYFRPGKWYDIGVKSESDFKDIIVTDYESMDIIDAKSAYYVFGSNVTSPAGDDLVAFETKADAQKFANKHNGKRVMKFSRVSDALIRLLNGRI
jgi:nitrous oxide reductase accessory protein NosL